MNIPNKILQEVICNRMRELTEERALDAMKTNAVMFARFIQVNAVPDFPNKDEWWLKQDSGNLRYTTEQLYELFKQSKK